MKHYIVFVISSVLLFTSCLMINNFETAQTAPVEQYQFFGNFSPYYFSLSTDEPSEHVMFYPYTEFIVKSGINENIDFGVGVRAIWYFPGLILNSKYQFLKSKIDGAISLEGAWYPGFIYGEDYNVFTLRSTLLFSQEKVHRFPFRIALGAYLWDYLENEFNPSFVANIGFPIRFGPNRKFRLMPDLGFLYGSRSGGLVQCGLSFGYVGEDVHEIKD